MPVVPERENERPLFGGNAQVFDGVEPPTKRSSKHNAAIAPEPPLAKVLRAANFAAQKHTRQRREDAHESPYVEHVLTVAHILASEGGVADLEILCAALLHDTVEDTDTSVAEIGDEFGDIVAGYVGEVTDDKSLPRIEQKRLQISHAPTLSPGAKLIKLADKIANVRDVVHNPPVDWGEDRKAAYLTWANEVVEALRGTSARLERVFDQARGDPGRG